MSMNKQQQRSKKKTIDNNAIKEIEITITSEGKVLFSEWHKDFLDFAKKLKFDQPYINPLVGNKIFCG